MSAAVASNRAQLDDRAVDLSKEVLILIVSRKPSLSLADALGLLTDLIKETLGLIGLGPGGLDRLIKLSCGVVELGQGVCRLLLLWIAPVQILLCVLRSTER